MRDNQYNCHNIPKISLEMGCFHFEFRVYDFKNAGQYDNRFVDINYHASNHSLAKHSLKCLTYSTHFIFFLRCHNYVYITSRSFK